MKITATESVRHARNNDESGFWRTSTRNRNNKKKKIIPRGVGTTPSVSSDEQVNETSLSNNRFSVLNSQIQVHRAPI